MLGPLAPMEVIVILAVALLLFGRRLPELGTGMGQFISNFKKSYRDGTAIDVTPKTETKKETEEKK